MLRQALTKNGRFGLIEGNEEFLHLALELRLQLGRVHFAGARFSRGDLCFDEVPVRLLLCQFLQARLKGILRDE
ncbi:MAG TPA: hypothetical protein VGP72_05585 [Planctomycetota bacterium]